MQRQGIAPLIAESQSMNPAPYPDRGTTPVAGRSQSYLEGRRCTLPMMVMRAVAKAGKCSCIDMWWLIRDRHVGS